MAYYATYMPNELGELQKVVINAGVGFVLPYYGETAPPGTLACDGSEISRAAYPELFAVLGTRAGAGNGSTTFNLPDFRGDFIRGLGGDNAGELGVKQSDAIRNITGHLSGFNAWIFDNLCNGCFAPGTVTPPNKVNAYEENQNHANSSYATFDASRVVPTAAENRPVNVALLWCIIYE